jgi:uncharacterized peroxidase-related enzyme
MLFKSLPIGKTISDVFKERPKVFNPVLTFVQNLLREEGYLEPKDRELIAAFTSSLNNCSFCTGSHRVFALSLAADQLDLDAALLGNYSQLKLAPVLRCVEILTRTPSALTQADVQQVLEAGFSEEQLKEAIVICAAFNMFNRIVEGHGIEENPQTWALSSEMINKFGYDGSKLNG